MTGVFHFSRMGLNMHRRRSSDQRMWLWCGRAFSGLPEASNENKGVSIQLSLKHCYRLLALAVCCYCNQRQREQISWGSHGENIKFYGLSQINKQIILRLCKLFFNNLSDYQRLHRTCLAKEQKLINMNIHLWAVPHWFFTHQKNWSKARSIHCIITRDVSREAF